MFSANYHKFFIVSERGASNRDTKTKMKNDLKIRNEDLYPVIRIPQYYFHVIRAEYDIYPNKKNAITCRKYVQKLRP